MGVHSVAMIHRPLARLLAPLLLAAAATTPGAIPKPGKPDATREWVRLDYGAIVDRRQLSHTGEAVGDLLRKLDGRSAPVPGERADDDAAHRVLDPVLEPYAFVLADALDGIAPRADRPRVEVGWLFPPGTAQPAWAELLRVRRYLVESDGAGSMRICLPYPSGETPGQGPEAPTTRSEAEAKAAWEAAWPVLRHVLASERARLAAAGKPESIEVTVHPYRHLPARTVFDLGLAPYRTKVETTAAAPGTPALDLAALEGVLASGRTLEGARLEPDGRLVWLTSDGGRPASLLGRPVGLSDVAVAYRAVAHGGAGDPYMSLDRAEAPHVAAVTFAGRLQDTVLGLVSLLADIRFKTLSQGIDIVTGVDLREAIRGELPEFKTHVERMAADPGAGSVASQQTRFWFYPDDVSLALSAEGDLLAIRRARLTAASEKVDPTTRRAVGEDPPWTKATVAFVNRHYDLLAKRFPELADLDVEVRLLALFTWLRQAKADGLPVPDLDALMAVELPAVPTPRRFPQLLVYDAIPTKGGGAVEVFEQSKVGEALERLQPRGPMPLPPLRRFERALGALDRRLADHAALAKELDSADARALPAEEIDRRAQRAERLIMHRLVLSTLGAEPRRAIEARRAAGAELRAFSIGIGGVDLGMGNALARATRRGVRMKATAGTAAATPRAVTSTPIASAVTGREPKATPLPPHGFEGRPTKRSASAAGGRIESEIARLDAGWIERGTWTPKGGKPIRFEQVVLGPDGTWAQSRRRIDPTDPGMPFFERLESGRFVAYRLEDGTDTIRAAVARLDLPVETFDGAASRRDASPAPLPEGLAILHLSASSAPSEAAAVGSRLVGPGPRDTSAEIPRGSLQRLVLGRALDGGSDRPLRGLTPAASVGAGARTILIPLPDALNRPPWTGVLETLPGDEDPVRIAGALTSWWAASGEPGAPAVAVATDPDRSPKRWAAATPPKRAIVLLPDDAFPVTGAAFLEALRRACAGVPTTASLEGVEDADVVVLASAESPGALGGRLRRLAGDPRLSGKAIAVWSAGGELRPDLPGSLLRDSGWTAFGLGDGGPLEPERAAAAIASFVTACAADDAPGRRIEAVPGPFVWHY